MSANEFESRAPTNRLKSSERLSYKSRQIRIDEAGRYRVPFLKSKK